MPTDRPSHADETLVHRLRRAGITDVTTARLQRWHKAGLMPWATPVRIAGHRGSASTYSSHAVEQALAVHRILRRYRNRHKAAVLLFLNGYEIAPKALKQAAVGGVEFVLTFQAADPMPPGVLGDGELPPADAADQLARIAANPPQRAPRPLSPTDVRERWTRVYAHAARLLTTPFTPGPLVGMVDQWGVLAALHINTDVATGLAAQIGARLGVSPLEDHLQDALRRASGDDFITARETIRNALTTLAAVGITLDEVPNGFQRDCYHALLHPERPPAE